MPLMPSCSLPEEVSLEGTLCYGGATGLAAAQRLAKDWLSGTLTSEEPLGCFCVKWLADGCEYALVDPSGMFSLFVVDGRIVCTSLREAIGKAKEPAKLDAMALVELVLTGFVSPPDTIFEGVKYWCPGVRVPGWHVERAPGSLGCEEPPLSRQKAVTCLLERCEALMASYRKCLGDVKAGIGLSGGYDSRLLLLLAKRVGFRIYTFSYTSEAHREEAAIAAQVAAAADVPFVTVPVELWRSLSDQRLEENQADALAFWDGRTNESMGTFNDVHTARTRRNALGNASVGLNGLGGELFRNREHTPPWLLRYDDWIAMRVARGNASWIMRDRKEERRALDLIGNKYAGVLKRKAMGWISRTEARSIYKQLWLPIAAGARLQAENRVTPSLMPFAERSVTAAALACSEWIGLGGDLEAAMIRTLDSSGAAIQSTYGHSFSRIGMKARLRWLASAVAPLRLRRRRGWALRDSQAPADDGVLQRGPMGATRRGLALFREICPWIRWEETLRPGEVCDRVLFTAHFVGTVLQATASAAAPTAERTG